MAVLRRPPFIVPVVAAVVAIVVVGVVFFALRAGSQTTPKAAYHDSLGKAPQAANPDAPVDQAKVDAEARKLGLGTGRPKAVEPVAGEVADAGGGPTAEQLAAQGAKSGAAAPSLKELQSELTQLKRQVGISGHPRVTATGLAAIPLSTPGPVRSIVNAANKIALLPYRYGGGHNSNFRDNAYDCSASISYALAAAGLLGEPLTSGNFMKWGAPGRGKYVTIYANEGHAFMVVDGLRFDTGNLGGGTRWTAAPREAGGFTVRHPPGL